MPDQRRRLFRVEPVPGAGEGYDLCVGEQGADAGVGLGRAEGVAAEVPLKEGEHFTRARRRIRAALAEDGIAAGIDAMVAGLLDGGD